MKQTTFLFLYSPKFLRYAWLEFHNIVSSAQRKSYYEWIGAKKKC